MTLLFADSFDHYLWANVLDKYDNATATLVTIANAGHGRRGTDGLRVEGINTSSRFRMGRLVPESTTLIVGLAMYFTVGWSNNSNSATGLRFHGNEVAQIGVYIEEDGSLEVRRGSHLDTLLGATAAGTMVINTWYYLELKATIHDTTGSFEVLLDGISVLSDTDIDTKGASVAYADQARLYVYSPLSSYKQSFDDFYICNDEGSINNDFLGDVEIQAKLPNGAGNYTQWTPSSGSNFENVDEVNPNDDTDHNESSTIGEKDSYGYEDLSVAGVILGVVQHLNVRKTTGGSRHLSHLVRSGGADFTSGSPVLSDSYKYLSEVWENNPNTSSPWLKSEFDAAEFGVEVHS